MFTSKHLNFLLTLKAIPVALDSCSNYKQELLLELETLTLVYQPNPHSYAVSSNGADLIEKAVIFCNLELAKGQS